MLGLKNWVQRKHNQNAQTFQNLLALARAHEGITHIDWYTYYESRLWFFDIV